MSPVQRPEFSRTTTIHGVTQAASALSIPTKLFWSVLVFAATGITVFSIATVISDYISAPVGYSIGTVRSATMEMPDLVVCPRRGLNATKMIAEQMPLPLASLVMSNSGSDMGWGIGLDDNITGEELNDQMITFMSTHRYGNYKNFLMHYSYDTSAFVRQLTFAAVNILVSSNQSKWQWGKIIGFDGGICFSYLNNGTLLSTPGMNNGYQLVLTLPKLQPWDKTAADGWKIGVTKPLKAAPSSYVVIPKNSAVDIELTRVSVKLLNRYAWPKSGQICRDSSFYQNSDICAAEAWGLAIQTVCNCTYISTVNNVNDSTYYCTDTELTMCFRDNQTLIFKMTVAAQHECLPVCSETLYGTKTSYGDINRQVVETQFDIPNGTDVSIVRIAYTRMESTQITSYETISGSTMLSNIGGQLGLWVGASLISLIHLISYVPTWFQLLDRKMNFVK